jgi:hypothetical protein
MPRRGHLQVGRFAFSTKKGRFSFLRGPIFFRTVRDRTKKQQKYYSKISTQKVHYNALFGFLAAQHAL